MGVFSFPGCTMGQPEPTTTTTSGGLPPPRAPRKNLEDFVFVGTSGVLFWVFFAGGFGGAVAPPEVVWLVLFALYEAVFLFFGGLHQRVEPFRKSLRWWYQCLEPSRKSLTKKAVRFWGGTILGTSAWNSPGSPSQTRLPF